MALSRRELEVAELVALGLTNRAIAQRLFLSERTVEGHIDRAFSKLGFSSRTQLAMWVGTSARSELPTARGASSFPTQLTSFVGRQNDLAALDALLKDHRLVTITGSGGFGKTRLAVEVASRCATAYQDGVVIAELAPIVDPALITETIGIALNLPRNADRGLEAGLRAYLHKRQMLIVLDNCEHLVQWCADLSAALLSACPSLRILATSREPLGVAGEAVWRLSPLTVPPSDTLALDDLTAYEAVALFAQRAAAAAPGFKVQHSNAEAVASICRRLDGIPLAIELAAARLRVMTARDIVSGLEHDSMRLGGGIRTAPGRHRTLRTTFQWSYALLDPGEKALFPLLGTFAGGFDRDAVLALSAASEIPGDVEPMLDGLVDKSLVTASSDEDQRTRYRLLETLRNYAMELLEERGQRDGSLRHHFEYFAALAERAEPGLYGPDQIAWVRRLDDDLDNLRSAIEWALKRDVSGAVAIAGALTDFWIRTGRASEGRAWIGRALALGTVDDLARTRAVIGTAFLSLNSVAAQEVAAMADMGLTMARKLGDDHLLATALAAVGSAAIALGDKDRAEQTHSELLQLSDRPGYEGLYALALVGLSNAAWEREQRQQALELIERGVAKVRPAGDWNVLALVLEFGAERRILAGDLDAARSHWLEAFAVTDHIHERVNLVGPLYGLALVDALQNKPRRSLRLVACADRLRAETDQGFADSPAFPRAVVSGWFHDHEVEQLFRRTLETVRSELTLEEAAREWVAGRALEPTEAAALAADPGKEERLSMPGTTEPPATV